MCRKYLALAGASLLVIAGCNKLPQGDWALDYAESECNVLNHTSGEVTLTGYIQDVERGTVSIGVGESFHARTRIDKPYISHCDSVLVVFSDGKSLMSRHSRDDKGQFTNPDGIFRAPFYTLAKTTRLLNSVEVDYTVFTVDITEDAHALAEHR